MRKTNLPPVPEIGDDIAMSNWYSRVRDAILNVGGSITWSNLDFSGSNITDIVTRNHNDLQSIQGGSNGQRYHLTAGEHTNLTDGGETTLHTHSYGNLTNRPVYGGFYSTTDQTLAATNTATVITFDSQSLADDITIVSGTQITVPRTGVYSVSFSAQITSTSASTKNIWFWPKINGTDVPNSGFKTSISDNGFTQPSSRNGQFSLTAGDYIEAYWAADSTSVELTSTAATAFAPASPSVIIGIYQVD